MKLNKSQFLVFSVLFAFLALSTHLLARNIELKGVDLRLRSLTSEVTEKSKLRVKAVELNDTSAALRWIGISFFGCSVVAFIVARRRSESGWFSIPVILWVCDFLSIFML